MRYRMLVICGLLVLPLLAQNEDEKLKARYESRKGDFDYLLGDWEFTADNKEWGKARGFWSAIRLGEDGPIVDEYRVVGDKGETWYVTQTVRNFNAALDRWDLVSTERGMGLQNTGTGRREGQEIRIEQTFGSSIWRIRYYDIKPDRFSWAADRSTDGGKSWVKEFHRIEARRIGAARATEILAPARK